jgi:hypothetical protein
MVALVCAMVVALGILVAVALFLERIRPKAHDDSGEPMGTSYLEHPEPEIGAYSAASSGVNLDLDLTPAEGPMQHID